MKIIQFCNLLSVAPPHSFQALYLELLDGNLHCLLPMDKNLSWACDNYIDQFITSPSPVYPSRNYKRFLSTERMQ